MRQHVRVSAQIAVNVKAGGSALECVLRGQEEEEGTETGEAEEGPYQSQVLDFPVPWSRKYLQQRALAPPVECVNSQCETQVLNEEGEIKEQAAVSGSLEQEDEEKCSTVQIFSASQEAALAGDEEGSGLELLTQRVRFPWMAESSEDEECCHSQEPEPAPPYYVDFMKEPGAPAVPLCGCGRVGWSCHFPTERMEYSLPDVQFERYGNTCFLCRGPRDGEEHGFGETATDQGVGASLFTGRVPSAQLQPALNEYTPLPQRICGIVCAYNTPDQRQLPPWSPEMVGWRPEPFSANRWLPNDRFTLPQPPLASANNAYLDVLGVQFIHGRDFQDNSEEDTVRDEYESVAFDFRWFPTARLCRCMKRILAGEQYEESPCSCWPVCCQIMRICAVIGLDPCRFNVIMEGDMFFYKQHRQMDDLYKSPVPYYQLMTVATADTYPGLGCEPCSSCVQRGYKFFKG